MKKRAVSLFSWVLFFLFYFQSTALAAEEIVFYHTDNAGTPLAMSDMTGKRVWRADYKPFGEEFSVEGGAGERKRFVGKEKDEETGLDYFGARYHDSKTGRFIATDSVRSVDEKTSKTNKEMLQNPQRLNTYAYGLSNPYKYVDLDGRDVTIIIRRERYTDNSLSGTISVTSDVTTTSFSGYTLENVHAGDKHDKSPISPGTYNAFVREDHTPNRVELKDVVGYKNIQIHTGNTARNVKGCFAVGITCSIDFVGESKKAMQQINEVIKKDGTRNIRVTVVGTSTKP